MSRGLTRQALVSLALLLVVGACSGDSAPATTAEATASTAAATPTPLSGVVTGVDGVEVDISDPSRIVSMAGDITEIIFAMGYGDRVVGIDVTTVHPEEASGLPIVGVGRFMNAEAVLGVQPTLVIVDDQAAPAAAIDQIRAAGVPVLVTHVATTFDGLYDKVRTLGSVVGDLSAAESLVGRIRAEVEAAVVTREDGLRIAYIYTRGPDVVLLFGEGMVSNPVIEAVGAVDAGVDRGIVGSVSATAEAIVAAAPDVIVVPEEGYSILGGIEPFLEIPGIAETPAGRNRLILAYPEGDFLTFGPRVAESIRRLAADLES